MGCVRSIHSRNRKDAPKVGDEIGPATKQTARTELEGFSPSKQPYMKGLVERIKRGSVKTRDGWLGVVAIPCSARCVWCCACVCVAWGGIPSSELAWDFFHVKKNKQKQKRKSRQEATQAEPDGYRPGFSQVSSRRTHFRTSLPRGCGA